MHWFPEAFFSQDIFFYLIDNRFFNPGLLKLHSNQY